jgi:predicted acetyltransferase
MKNMFLSCPRGEYKKSFENYILAYKRKNDIHYFNIYKNGLEDFYSYINYLNNLSKGIDIPEGWVSTSTFWLIDNEEVVGVVRVRHEEVSTAGHIGYDISPCYRNKGYGTQILRLALVEAKKIGLKEVIVTCNIDNIASRKIIEKNNGELLGTVFDEEENETLYRYNLTRGLGVSPFPF